MKKILPVFLLLAATACASMIKVSSIRKSGVSPELSMPQDVTPAAIEIDTPSGDTLKVRDAQGRELLIMRAVRDDNGEMVANETLGAAVVVAKFKNVAERNGQVDLHFVLKVPAAMLDHKWQLRLYPVVTVNSDSLALDPVYVTGDAFRRVQLRGYQQYQRFLSSIITDSTKFIRAGDLEVFLRRNIPELYAFKTDTSYVSDAAFLSVFGVSQREALLHYTRSLLLRYNSRKLSSRQRVFDRLVKVPIVTAGIRKDTILNHTDEDFVYEYVRTIQVSPGMRKADVFMSGEVFEHDRRIFDIPHSGPVTFYISSLSTLVDSRDKFRTRIIERREDASNSWNIAFRPGSASVDSSFLDNSVQIRSILNTLKALAEDEVFDLDSVNVFSSCSPEGSATFNAGLSLRRSASVASYFGNGEIPFRAGSLGEDWDALDALVASCPGLEESCKERYASIRRIADPDVRERALSGEPFYRFMRDSLYPALRTVKFDFHLHRKGMVRDTIHTTEPDTSYMRAVDLIRERRYLESLSLLVPYADYNTALCYVGLGRNRSALNILESCPRTPRVRYLLALVLSRLGDDAGAVENYLKACNEDRAFVHRGNLDPEISSLVKKYKINQNY